MTDASGAIVWAADYKPFGEATVTVSTITNNLRFPGQYYDAETGLNYNYYRDYNPVIGRYVEADPIGLRGGINLFSYAADNPIMFTDPLGLLLGGNNAVIGPPQTPVIRKPPPPPQQCVYGCHPGYPPPSPYPQGCWDCDWQRIGECIGVAADQDQIEMCKTVCEFAKQAAGTPYGKIARALCYSCVLGKAAEVTDCFRENCKWKECCKK